MSDLQVRLRSDYAELQAKQKSTAAGIASIRQGVLGFRSGRRIQYLRLFLIAE